MPMTQPVTLYVASALGGPEAGRYFYYGRLRPLVGASASSSSIPGS